jgi:hypothetical protein
MANKTISGTCTEVGTYINQGGSGITQSWVRQDSAYRIVYNSMYWVVTNSSGSVTEFTGTWVGALGPNGTYTAVSDTGTCIVSDYVAPSLASELAGVMGMM